MTYTERFQKFFPWLIARETEYESGHYGDLKFARVENVSGDSGGLTKFGIDQRSHPKINIRALTLEDAEEIYFTEWTKAPCDEGELPEQTAYTFFDIQVNGGMAATWLQQILNNFLEAKLQPMLDVDGWIGKKTLEASNQFDDSKIAIALLQRRRLYYQRIVAKHPDQRKFLKGWLNRNKELVAFLDPKIDPLIVA